MIMNSKSFIQAAVLVSATLMGSLANANLVTNGGFEDGLSGWQNDGNFTLGSFNGYTPFGTSALYFGCVGQLCSTRQTIATTAGSVSATPRSKCETFSLPMRIVVIL